MPDSLLRTWVQASRRATAGGVPVATDKAIGCVAGNAITGGPAAAMVKLQLERLECFLISRSAVTAGEGTGTHPPPPPTPSLRAAGDDSWLRVGGRSSARNSGPTSEGAAWTLAQVKALIEQDAPLRVDQGHKKGGQYGLRFDGYKAAETANEYHVRLGGTAADLRYDLSLGHAWLVSAVGEPPEAGPADLENIKAQEPKTEDSDGDDMMGCLLYSHVGNPTYGADASRVTITPEEQQQMADGRRRIMTQSLANSTQRKYSGNFRRYTEWLDCAGVTIGSILTGDDPRAEEDLLMDFVILPVRVSTFNTWHYFGLPVSHQVGSSR